MSRLHANLLLLLAGAVWGLTFVAQATAMRDVEPFTFIAARFALASALLAPLALRERGFAATRTDRPVSTGDVARFALIGLVLFLGMGLQQTGLLSTSVTHSGFLTGLYVVITPLLAVLLFRERPHAIVWPAAALSFLGVFLLSGGEWHALVTGDILTLGSALCWALQVVMVARFVQQSDRPFLLSFVQFAVCALLGTAVAVLLESPDAARLAGAGMEIFFSGVFGTALAFTLQVLGQRHTSSAQAALFLSSEAPFAALCAAILLGERMPQAGLFGCALIFAAMLAVELVPAFDAGRRGTA